ncbi:hypothetical protein JYK02_28740 [Corallococcus macrosporus]|uniref:NERD domain-containing protein n=1 Tax=Corallococcus macrosporus TaxID=35 RepID=A0ABS3DJK8_9BACT|nr:hypothetical protein [Corallococcus macrosporus]MBN8231507.1 hypothetical protein [Corallococcus macrosporus]
MNPRFDRLLDREVEGLVAPGGPLHFLVTRPGTKDGEPLDVHLREGNIVTLYLGLTKLLDIKLMAGAVKLSADAFYRGQAAALALFPTQSNSAQALPHQLAATWDAYRDNLQVQKSKVGQEGPWQTRLSRRYGPGFRTTDPWCVIDRECVIGYPNARMRKEIHDDLRARHAPVAQSLLGNQELRLKTGSQELRGNEVDALAVTPQGDLFIMEVKHGRDAAGLYSAPIQLWGYLEQWRRLREAQSGLRESINRMIEQRKRLKLLPGHAPMLREGFELKPLVMVGGPPPSPEVLRRFSAVRETVERFHPGSVGGLAIEQIESPDP